MICPAGGCGAVAAAAAGSWYAPACSMIQSHIQQTLQLYILKLLTATRWSQTYCKTTYISQKVGQRLNCSQEKTSGYVGATHLTLQGGPKGGQQGTAGHHAENLLQTSGLPVWHCGCKSLSAAALHALLPEHDCNQLQHHKQHISNNTVHSLP